MSSMFSNLEYPKRGDTERSYGEKGGRMVWGRGERRSGKGGKMLLAETENHMKLRHSTGRWKARPPNNRGRNTGGGALESKRNKYGKHSGSNGTCGGERQGEKGKN